MPRDPDEDLLNMEHRDLALEQARLLRKIERHLAKLSSCVRHTPHINGQDNFTISVITQQ